MKICLPIRGKIRNNCEIYFLTNEFLSKIENSFFKKGTTSLIDREKFIKTYKRRANQEKRIIIKGSIQIFIFQKGNHSINCILRGISN